MFTRSANCCEVAVSLLWSLFLVFPVQLVADVLDWSVRTLPWTLLLCIKFSSILYHGSITQLLVAQDGLRSDVVEIESCSRSRACVAGNNDLMS